eukprot:6189070-Pleurochrysis_carterae.AAC.5
MLSSSVLTGVSDATSRVADRGCPSIATARWPPQSARRKTSRCGSCLQARWSRSPKNVRPLRRYERASRHPQRRAVIRFARDHWSNASRHVVASFAGRTLRMGPEKGQPGRSPSRNYVHRLVTSRSGPR